MIDDEISRAFFAWTSVSNLTIQKTKFSNVRSEFEKFNKKLLDLNYLNS